MVEILDVSVIENPPILSLFSNHISMRTCNCRPGKLSIISVEFSSGGSIKIIFTRDWCLSSTLNRPTKKTLEHDFYT